MRNAFRLPIKSYTVSTFVLLLSTITHQAGGQTNVHVAVFNNSEIRFVTLGTATTVRADADNACKNNNSELIAVKNLEIQNFLIAEIPKTSIYIEGTHTHPWDVAFITGGHQLTAGGNWTWMDGTLLPSTRGSGSFSNWLTDHPSRNEGSLTLQLTAVSGWETNKATKTGEVGSNATGAWIPRSFDAPNQHNYICQSFCLPGVCRNRGNCTSSLNGFQCQYEICEVHSCLNGGTCNKINDTDYACACTASYKGDFCENIDSPFHVVQHNGERIVFHNVSLNRTAAEEYCARNFMHLLHVTDEQLHRVVRDNIGNVSVPIADMSNGELEREWAKGFWTSGRHVDGAWRWGDGTAINPKTSDRFQQWFGDEPNQSDSCLNLTPENRLGSIDNVLARWKDDNCDAEKYFICQGQGVLDTAHVVRANGHRFNFYAVAMNHSAAGAYCRQTSAHLVRVTSAWKQRVIGDSVGNVSIVAGDMEPGGTRRDFGFWTAGALANGSAWRWDDGTAVNLPGSGRFSAWFGVEPNGDGLCMNLTPEDELTLNNVTYSGVRGGWRDDGCRHKKYFICEEDPPPTTASEITTTPLPPTTEMVTTAQVSTTAESTTATSQTASAAETTAKATTQPSAENATSAPSSSTAELSTTDTSQSTTSPSVASPTSPGNLSSSEASTSTAVFATPNATTAAAASTLSPQNVTITTNVTSQTNMTSQTNVTSQTERYGVDVAPNATAATTTPTADETSTQAVPEVLAFAQPDISNVTTEDVETYVENLERLNENGSNNFTKDAVENITNFFVDVSRMAAAGNITIEKTTLAAIATTSSLIITQIAANGSSATTAPDVKRVMRNIVQSLEALSLAVVLAPNEVFTQTTEHFVMQAEMHEKTPNQSSTSFNPFNSTGSRIIIPAAAMRKAMAAKNGSYNDTSPGLWRSGYFFYESDALFPTNKNVSSVISAKLSGNNRTVHITNLTDPVIIIFQTHARRSRRAIADSVQQNRTQMTCVFWDPEKFDWSSSGCCRKYKSDPPECQCTHLTNFALITKSEFVHHEVVLSIVSDIACCLSITCLLLTLEAYLTNRQQRVKTSVKVFLHVCGNLTMVMWIFLIGVEQTENPYVCLFITCLLHYFSLTTWCWVTAYGYDIDMSFRRVMNKCRPSYLPNLTGFAYGVPAVVVGFNVMIAVGYFDSMNGSHLCGGMKDPLQNSAYKAVNMCWLGGYSNYFGFLLPFGLMLCYHVFVCFSVFRHVSISEHAHYRQTDHFTLFIFFFSTTGFIWFFAYFLLLSDDEGNVTVTAWLIALSTAAQGLSVYVFSVVRKPQVFEKSVVGRLCFCCETAEDDEEFRRGQEGTEAAPGSAGATRT